MTGSSAARLAPRIAVAASGAPPEASDVPDDGSPTANAGRPAASDSEGRDSTRRRHLSSGVQAAAVTARLRQLYELRDRLDREIEAARAGSAGKFLQAVDSPEPVAVPAEIRAWAVYNGLPVGGRGRVPDQIIALYHRHHGA